MSIEPEDITRAYLPDLPFKYTAATPLSDHESMSQATRRSLDDWSFTQVDGGQGTAKDEWLDVASFPTTVHVELIQRNKIPDPVSSSIAISTARCSDSAVYRPS